MMRATVLILWTRVRNPPFRFLFRVVLVMSLVTLMNLTAAGTTPRGPVTLVNVPSCGLGIGIMLMPGLTA